MVIACTNRSREEVVTDQSTEALMQRFVYEKEVKWTTHSHTDYAKAIEHATRDDEYRDGLMIESVAAICADIMNSKNPQSCEKDYVVSPRTCVKAYYSALVNDLVGLSGFYGFEKAVNREIPMNKHRKEMFDQKQHIKDIADIANTMKIASQNEDRLPHLAASMKVVHGLKDILSSAKAWDTNLGYRDTVQRELDDVSSEIFKRIRAKLEPQNPPAGTWAAKMKGASKKVMLNLTKLPEAYGAILEKAKG